MGKFIGRDMLLDHLDQVSSKASNEFKGLKGEIKVGDFLAKYLPDDTYVIAKPVIGKYEPDFLVISPHYGFRLIEVKNWSLNSIKSIQSNGVFTIVGGKIDNPIQQVRKHVEDLKGYLLSNYSYLGDPHKLIGYVNIQYGFNKWDINKFAKNWDGKNAGDFFTFHIFKDELDSQLDHRLKLASKFRTNTLPEKWIEDLVKKIRVTNSKLSDSEVNLLLRSEELDRTAIELKEITKQTKQMIEEQRKLAAVEYTSNHSFQEQDNRKNKTSFRRIILLILGAVIVFFIVSNVFEKKTSENIDETFKLQHYDEDAFTNINVQQAFSYPGNSVKVVAASVESFYYDNSSENKFLKLNVDGFTFDAVIYKDTKTPYINEGENYTFYGVTQEYEGQIELEITTVE